MGEAKRKREAMTPADKAGVDLTRKLMNDGMLLEGGFAALVVNHNIPLDSPSLPMLRDVYMAGAEHLWSSIFATLGSSEHESEAEFKRMDAVQREVDAWRKVKMEAFARAYPTKGNA